MTDDEIRELVRSAIARHLGSSTAPRPAPATQPPPAQPGQQLPSEVRQKLEQLRQNDKRPGRRR